MKIAFVGASGYGNVGDDAYKRVFSQQLAEHEVLFFNSDIPPSMPEDIDLLVMGGGGILYNNPSPEVSPPESPHFRKMRFYMDWAMAHKVPWGISSCGFQFRPGEDHNFEVPLEPWRRYLEQAKFITLRSPRCAEVACALTGRTDVDFFPDACYLLTPSALAKAGRPMVTLVPSGPIRAGGAFTERMVLFCESADLEIVWMSMGAPVDDDRFLDAVREKHPHHCIIARPSPEEALAQIAASRFVVTGRYHGMVFARRNGVPFYFPEEVPYKLRNEDFRAVPSQAAGHIARLRSVISDLQTSGSATQPAFPC